jgi:hypothetical protein
VFVIVNVGVLTFWMCIWLWECDKRVDLVDFWNGRIYLGMKWIFVEICANWSVFRRIRCVMELADLFGNEMDFCGNLSLDLLYNEVSIGIGIQFRY